MATASMAAVASPAGLVSTLSSRGTMATRVQSAALVTPARARTVCSASAQEENRRSAPLGESAGKAAAALALAAIVGTGAFAAPEEAMADISGLTPCKDSKAFQKREKTEIKKLESRLKMYAADSAPAVAINATVERTKRRFNFYGDAGLLCGTDGLPHLIVDGDQKHLGEFVYPGIVFLYITGWIGWVGREYLRETTKMKKATEKEIIIDVPLALSKLWKGAVWPLAAIRDFRNGTLVVDDSKIPISPR